MFIRHCPRCLLFATGLAGLALLLAAGCTPQAVSTWQRSLQSQPIVQPTPAPTPTPAAYATLRTRGGNLRAGPGMAFPVLAVIDQGDAYPIVGRDAQGDWWQLCCVPEPADEGGGKAVTAWVAASIVDVEGDTAQISGPAPEPDLGEPLFPDDFTARWQVAYRCDSERCEVAQCAGEAVATVRSVLRNTWLEIDRAVTWPEQCGEDTVAGYQVHRYTGQDRYLGADAAFFDRYWAGADPGQPVKTLRLADGRSVQAWCTGTQTVERQVDASWLNVYDGEACYDAGTGLLLKLAYARRWLYTGTVEGKSYERAFFGDTEYFDLALEATNARLSVVK